MTIKKEIFPNLDKKKKLNPCSLTKEKVESHLLDITLFLDSSLLVNQQNQDITLAQQKSAPPIVGQNACDLSKE